MVKAFSTPPGRRFNHPAKGPMLLPGDAGAAELRSLMGEIMASKAAGDESCTIGDLVAAGFTRDEVSAHGPRAAALARDFTQRGSV